MFYTMYMFVSLFITLQFQTVSSKVKMHLPVIMNTELRISSEGTKTRSPLKTLTNSMIKANSTFSAGIFASLFWETS